MVRFVAASLVLNTNDTPYKYTIIFLICGLFSVLRLGDNPSNNYHNSYNNSANSQLLSPFNGIPKAEMRTMYFARF